MEHLDFFRDVSINPAVVTISSALLTHLYFKRYEPQSPIVALSILFGTPSFLSLLDAYAGRNPAFALSTLGTFAIYFGTLVGSIVAYRVSPFHPLANYPGPFIARVSKLWMLLISSTGKPHEYYAQLHEKYGNIVRTGPNEVIIRDPAAIRPLMGTGGWGKSAYWPGRTLNVPIPSLIGVRDGPEHAKRRRTWNRGFSPASLRDYEPMVRERILGLSKAIAQRGQVDLSIIFGYFTFDIMADMGLGGGTNLVADGDPEGFLHLIDAALKNGSRIGQMPWLGRYAKLIPGIGGKVRRFQAFAVKQLERRGSEGSQRKDLFYHLADEAGAEKQPIPHPIILSDSALVIIAGSDTSATVLSSLFFYLLRDPKAFERLRAEIDKFYTRGEEITTEHFNEMHYLEACVNEALRLSPAVPSGSQRAVIHPDSSRGKMVGPYYIPEGTAASVNFLGIQRDPKNFSPFSNNFWPDRWLVAEGLIETPVPGEFIHDTTAFIPFSYGPSSCVGKPLAMLELRMTTAYLVRDFDFKFAPGYKETWESDLRDYFTFQKGELPVIASLRT